MASNLTFKNWTYKLSIVIVLILMNIKQISAVVDCGLLTDPVRQLYTPKDTIIAWPPGLGSVDYLNGSTTVGSLVQFGCEKGHYVHGNKYAVCRNDGKWGIDGHGLLCFRIECVKPHFNIENGNIHTFLDYYGRYKLDSIYWVTCDFGYKPNGDAIRVCLVNGTKYRDGTKSYAPLYKGIWTQQDKTGEILPGGDTLPACIKDKSNTSCNTSGLINLKKCRSLISNNLIAATETDAETNEIQDHSNYKGPIETRRKCHVEIVFLVIFGLCYIIGFIGTIRLASLKCYPCNWQRCKKWIVGGIVRSMGHFVLPWYFYQKTKSKIEQSLRTEHERNIQSLLENYKEWSRLENENKKLKTELETNGQKIKDIQTLMKANQQLRTDERNWNATEKTNILMRIEKIDGLATSFNADQIPFAAVERREEDQPLLPDNRLLNQLSEENSLMRRDNMHNETTLDEIKNTLREIDPTCLQRESTSAGGFLYFIGQLKGMMGDHTNVFTLDCPRAVTLNMSMDSISQHQLGYQLVGNGVLFEESMGQRSLVLRSISSQETFPRSPEEHDCFYSAHDKIENEYIPN